MAFVAGGAGFGGRLSDVRRTCGTTAAKSTRPRHSVVFADLLGSQSATPVEPSRDDVMLAELRFSDPARLPNLVAYNRDKLDDSFFQYMDKKISDESNLEERETLTMLKEAVLDIMDRTADMAPQIFESNADLTREETYEKLLEAMLNYRDGAEKAVEKFYDKIDNDFLELLKGKAETDAAAMQLLQLVFQKMNKTLAQAQEHLATVLKTKSRGAMIERLEALHSDGDLNESFMLLLAGNIEQAKQAGVAQAVEALSMVQQQANAILDESASAEMRLIRKLLREESAEVRKQMLADAFKAASTLMLDEETEAETKTNVDAREFVRAMKTLMEQFGNMKEDLKQKLRIISEESEEIARALLSPQEKDIRTLQDEAFHKRSVSVWELEQVEMQQEMQGNAAPWENPTGFDQSGKRRV